METVTLFYITKSRPYSRARRGIDRIHI